MCNNTVLAAVGYHSFHISALAVPFSRLTVRVRNRIPIRRAVAPQHSSLELGEERVPAYPNGLRCKTFLGSRTDYCSCDAVPTASTGFLSQDTAIGREQPVQHRLVSANPPP